MFVIPVVLPSIKEKFFHWYACLYASRLFLGTISLHLDLLMPLKTPDSPPDSLQNGGTTASLEICVILLQLLNAYIPIVLTLFPIFTFCRLVLFEYLQPIITQYFIDNKSEIWLLFLIAHSKR